jgi:hypothetical protein
LSSRPAFSPRDRDRLGAPLRLAYAGGMKILALTFSFSLAALGLAACSDDSTSNASSSSSSGSVSSASSGSSSGSTSGDGGGADASSSSNSGGPAGNAPSGTVGGAAFVAKSGFWHENTDGSIDLVFSNQADVCQATKDQKLRGGESLLQFFALKGTAPGPLTPSLEEDLKYASIKATCTSGQPIGKDDVEKSSRAQTFSFTLSAKSANVSGTLDVKFEDGSTVAGSFDVPACDAEIGDDLTCF